MLAIDFCSSDGFTSEMISENRWKRSQESSGDIIHLLLLCRSSCNFDLTAEEAQSKISINYVCTCLQNHELTLV